MNVVISRRLEPNQGIDTYTQLLVKGTKEFQRFNVFEYRSDIYGSLLESSFRKKLWYAGQKLYRDQIDLPKYLKKVKADIFHCTEGYGIPVYSPCKIITTIHDLIPMKFQIWSRFQCYRFAKQTAYAIRKSEKIITVSQSSKRDIVNNFNVAQDKVIVTYLCVDKEFKIDKKQENITKKFNIKKPYMMIIGGANPRKNYKRIIDIFLSKYQDDYQLVIVGGAFTGMQFETSVTREKNLIFTGFIDKLTLIALYNSAELFIYPSLYEGFGLPILEAMACGTPVITSNTSSMPEVAGDAAVLIDPYDNYSIEIAMKKVLSDKTMQNELVHKGFMQVEKFSCEKLVRETSEIYLYTFNIN